ncbi:ORF112 [White spot syndrome virus]|uniref:ORF112 n=1 Tax=White spot syndrome virus TaxID=342409 RepID=A0A2D3I674_9VIRU|nr:ORF112 [White spot syndrome virus]
MFRTGAKQLLCNNEDGRMITWGIFSRGGKTVLGIGTKSTFLEVFVASRFKGVMMGAWASAIFLAVVSSILDLGLCW